MLSSGEIMGEGRKLKDYAEVAYLTGRTMVVTDHFDSALGIDDFLHRLEIALFAYGFNGDNAIGACARAGAWVGGRNKFSS